MPAKEKYKPAHSRPTDSPSGIATTFELAPAIPPASADAADQSSPRPSTPESTKSFAEAAPFQSSSSAECGSPSAQTCDDQPLHADTPAPSPAKPTTKLLWKSFEAPEVGQIRGRSDVRLNSSPFRWANSTKTFGTPVVAVPITRQIFALGKSARRSRPDRLPGRGRAFARLPFGRTPK